MRPSMDPAYSVQFKFLVETWLPEPFLEAKRSDDQILWTTWKVRKAYHSHGVCAGIFARL
jgi:hypothetical protein